jgi:hypothetical protein
MPPTTTTDVSTAARKKTAVKTSAVSAVSKPRKGGPKASVEFTSDLKKLAPIAVDLYEKLLKLKLVEFEEGEEEKIERIRSLIGDGAPDKCRPYIIRDFDFLLGDSLIDFIKKTL